MLRLHDAVLHGTIGQVAALVEVGADVNMGCMGGSYPLMLAAYRGDAAIVTLLLDKGAAPVMPFKPLPSLPRHAVMGRSILTREQTLVIVHKRSHCDNTPDARLLP
jgi:ankyrin repeat protein